MKTILIPTRSFQHPLKYLFKDEIVDILGAILVNLGYSIPDKSKFPSELKLEIPHFTKRVRNRVVDTELTYSILNLDIFPRKEAVAKANELLRPYNYELVLVEPWEESKYATKAS